MIYLTRWTNALILLSIAEGPPPPSPALPAVDSYI